MRVFLGPHRARRAGGDIEQARFLIDRAARFQHINLAVRFVFDDLHHEAHRVDVLGLGTGAQFIAHFAHGDVHVGAHRAFFHIAIARAHVTQDRAQLAHIGARFGGRAHVGLRHDFHQRNAAAVQVDIGHGRVLIVHQLARILFNVDALDADNLVFGNTGLLVFLDQQRAFAHQRVVELADLIALRQIGVEVVLAVKARPRVDLGFDGHAGAHGLADAFGVGHGQHAGHGRVNKADLAVGLRAKSGGGAGKQLRIRSHLRVHFKADYDLPFAGCALDAVCAHVSTLLAVIYAGLSERHLSPGNSELRRPAVASL